MKIETQHLNIEFEFLFPSYALFLFYFLGFFSQKLILADIGFCPCKSIFVFYFFFQMRPCRSFQVLTEEGFGPITTEIAEAKTFYYAEDYHQQYLSKNPDGYCGLGGTGISCPIGTKTKA